MSHRRRPAAIPVRMAWPGQADAVVPRPRCPRYDAASGSTVIRVDLGISEWALVLPRSQPGSALAGQPPGSLAGMLARPVTSRLGLVRVPGLPSPLLGPAVLYYRHGQTVIYCAAAQITDFAARILSALAEQVMYEIAGPGSRIAVTPAPHSDLLQDAGPGPQQPGDQGRHPAKAVLAGDEVTFAVCSDLIDPRLARDLGSLWTAQAAHLTHPGIRRTRTPRPGTAGARA